MSCEFEVFAIFKNFFEKKKNAMVNLDINISKQKSSARWFSPSAWPTGCCDLSSWAFMASWLLSAIDFLITRKGSFVFRFSSWTYLLLKNSLTAL